MFHYIKRYDFPLVWLNLLFLLPIVLTPFPIAMLTKYGNYQVAVVFYATSMIAIGVMLSLLWGYASCHHRLVDKDLSRVITYFTLRVLTSPAIFLLSIATTFIRLRVAVYSWLAVLAFQWTAEFYFPRNAGSKYFNRL